MGGARRPRKGLAGGGRVRSAAGRSDRDCRFAQQRPALGIFRRSCDSPTPGSRSTGRTHRRAARRWDEQIACQVVQVRRSVSGDAPDGIFRRDQHRVRAGPGWCAAIGDARRWCMNRRIGQGVPPLQGAVMLGCVSVAALCSSPWHELCKRRRRKFSVHAGWFVGLAPGQGCPLQLAVSPTRRSGSLVQWSTRRSPCTTGGSNVVGVDYSSWASNI